MILLEDDELHFDFSFVVAVVVILLVFSFSESAGIKIEEAISFTTCSQ